MTTRADALADAGRLIAWSAHPKESPATSAVYHSLVTRYLDDADFAADADALAAGLGLNLTVDATVGAVAVADADSPLRRPTSELVARSIAPQRKALLGVALLGVVRVAYPNPGRLVDYATVGRVSVTGVVDYLNRLAGHLADQASDPEAGRPNLAEVHRAWAEMSDARSEARRASLSTKTGLVRKVAELLVDSGLLRKASDDEGGTYRTTPRLTAMVASMVTDSGLYADLIAVLAGHGDLDDTDDTDDTDDLTGGRQ